MTYTLDFTAEAREGLRQLEPVAQEMALDAIEEVATSPHAKRQRSGLRYTVQDFVYEAAGIRHIIFILLRVSHSRHKVYIMQIGKSSQPIGS